jgi:hypothetical protein
MTALSSHDSIRCANNVQHLPAKLPPAQLSAIACFAAVVFAISVTESTPRDNLEMKAEGRFLVVLRVPRMSYR